MSVTDAVGDSTYYAYGFHGTSAARAAAIRRTGYFRPSNKSYADGKGDWLGPGFYFWQDAPSRVWDWLNVARQVQRLGPDREVVIARVRLTDSLDLLDTRDLALLTDAFGSFVQNLPDGDPMPTNPADTTAPGWHPLDDAIAREMLRRSKRYGPPIASMRAPFREGDPLYPGSAFHQLGHVQIAVFQQSVIVDFWCERTPPVRT